ncbi:hypothetical protein V5O48_018211 [Marasmius crinis-equi]|uniref:Bacteriophage T5 Orf172 DNA-binding domain-containing protein n=1 Tax=Marasmius crinis-equi TaxID=585013 RepID=A0ABR3ELU1_9AGAR
MGRKRGNNKREEGNGDGKGKRKKVDEEEVVEEEQIEDREITAITPTERRLLTDKLHELRQKLEEAATGEAQMKEYIEDGFEVEEVEMAERQLAEEREVQRRRALTKARKRFENVHQMLETERAHFAEFKTLIATSTPKIASGVMDNLERARLIELRQQAAMTKTLSVHEEEGNLYAFRIEDPSIPPGEALVKVGRTVNFERRKAQWDAQCPSLEHFWFEPILVEHCHRTERLVHLELHKICLERPREECKDCHRRHQEIFKLVEGPGEDVFSNVIAPIVRKMSTIAATCPKP